MRSRFPKLLGRFLLAFGAAALALGTLSAAAAQPTVGLGTADSFGVLAGSAVTNTGSSVIGGNVGVSPSAAITGFPPGRITGVFHAADAVAAQAQSDTTTAYNDAAGRTPFSAVATELGGRTLAPGVYRNATLGITGTLTLDAEGDPNAVFVFQAGSTLITASSSQVRMINGARACNVFWQVGSSATLGTTTRFVGTVLAQTSITANNGATVQGRLLARTGAVTLDTNTITPTSCAAAAPTTTTTTAPATTTTTAPATTTTTTTAPATTTTAPSPTATAPVSGTSPDGTGGTGGTGPGTVAPAIPAPSAGDVAFPVTAGGASGTAATTPVAGPGAGDSPTTMTSLPRTGFGLAATAAGGALALLLGTGMVVRPWGRLER